MSWEVFDRTKARPRITVTERGAIMLNREARRRADFDIGDRVAIFSDRETGRFGLAAEVDGDGVATARRSVGERLAVSCVPFVRWFELVAVTRAAEIYDHDGRKLIGFRKT
jgi:bifunctional DNA-binding transcriptional regulator/antitoxin component of YhaV-PrlF toxin-antitoxin module